MLTEPVWPEGWGLRQLDECSSTMIEAGRIAPGLAAPEWVLALRQTGGTGRRGRAWVMPPGNFAATLVLPGAGGPARGALRSFLAALALDQALTKVTGTAQPFGLKWPNDVLLNGGKLAGILLQMLPGDTLAIGIGVNLAAAPAPDEVEPLAVRPVSLAGELGCHIAPLEFLIPLAEAFAALEEQFRREGFAPLRESWLARAVRLGEVIHARMGTEELTGVFETIDDQGQLLLRTASGLRAIPAAEISF